MSTIRPLAGQCLVSILPPKAKTETGLYLPDIAQDPERGERREPSQGVVIAVGRWKTTTAGLSILPDFQPGDTVLVSAYTGQKLDRQIGEHLKLCDINDVIAVLTPAENSAN